jgi:predicted O-methyltransferase YrrM
MEDMSGLLEHPPIPTYSHIWFIPSSFTILEQYANKDNISFLEIGAFEGYSANYFIDHFLQGNHSTITCVDPWIKYSESTVTKMIEWDNVINEDTYNIFINNTKVNSNKIIIKRGLSKDILPELHSEYDFIYIDGDHSEAAVWVDATLSFDILKINGIIIFDDYDWNVGDKSPKKAIDKFIQEYNSKIKILFMGYLVGIQKISN